MSFSKRLPRMAAFIYNRMLLPYPTRWTEIPWYHQLPHPCKNPPNCLTSFHSWCTHCIWFSCFWSAWFPADALCLCEELSPLPWVCLVRICIFASLWYHLICSCIPCISGRVEASSRNSFDEVQVFWVRVHRTYWAPPIVLIGKAQSGSVFTLHDNGGVKRCQPDPSTADFPFNLSCNDFICPLCRSNQWFP